MKDHPKISNGHKTELHCSQDAKKKKKAKPSKAPNIVHRDHVGMKRYDCQSRLVVTCTRGASPSTRIISVRIKHHEKHQPYFDVAMPPEAADIIRENLEWSTPSSIIPKVQAVYPQVTGKQVHKAWADMSESYGSEIICSCHQQRSCCKSLVMMLMFLRSTLRKE